jgi:hypothetical protein
MPSAIQVKENEKRKHASLTIVGMKQDLALRSGRLQGGVAWGVQLVEGVLSNDARYAQGKERMGIGIEGSYDGFAHGGKKKGLS